MREASKTLQDIFSAGNVDPDSLNFMSLDGPVILTYSGTIVRGDNVPVPNAPLSDVDLEWDSSSLIEGTGSAVLMNVPDPDTGEITQLVPKNFGDALAPFGSEILVQLNVQAGPFYESIPMGVFPITEVPDTSSSYYTTAGEAHLASETINLKFADRFDGVMRDRFTKIVTPKYRDSAYDELEHLVGFAAVRDLEDKTIPKNGITAYAEEDRGEAVKKVANILGGVPYFDSDGLIAVRSYAPGERVAYLVAGPYGRIESMSSSLSRDGMYNGAIVEGKDGAYHTEKWITDGPLSPAEWGRVPIFYKSDYFTSFDQTQEYAEVLLREKSVRQSREITLSCMLNPLLEIGDVVGLRDQLKVYGTPETDIRITEIKYSGNMMTIVGTEV